MYGFIPYPVFPATCPPLPSLSDFLPVADTTLWAPLDFRLSSRRLRVLVRTSRLSLVFHLFHFLHIHSPRSIPLPPLYFIQSDPILLSLFFPPAANTPSLPLIPFFILGFFCFYFLTLHDYSRPLFSFSVSRWLSAPPSLFRFRLAFM